MRPEFSQAPRPADLFITLFIEYVLGVMYRSSQDKNLTNLYNLFPPPSSPSAYRLFLVSISIKNFMQLNTLLLILLLSQVSWFIFPLYFYVQTCHT